MSPQHGPAPSPIFQSELLKSSLPTSRPYNVTKSSPPGLPSLFHIQSRWPNHSKDLSKHDLTGKVYQTHKYPFACGGHADVYKAKYFKNDHEDGQDVAVKVLRYTQSGESTRFLRETVLWSSAKHDHITPFLGVSFDFYGDGTPCLVSPYYRNGNLMHYINRHPDADKLTLLSQAASGLSYLHDLGIIHGDVKGNNILVNEKGQASLVDFGLALTLQATGFTTQMTSCTMRYLAPERVNAVNVEDATIPRVTKATDLWAFAMTVLEVLTKSKPFPNIKNDMNVALFVGRGGLPDRQRCRQINDCIWDVLQRCWDPNPSKRPSMADLSLFFAERATFGMQFSRL